MSCKRFYKNFYLYDGKAVAGPNDKNPLDESDITKLLSDCENSGCDGAIIFDLADTDNEREVNLGVIKNIKRSINLPIIMGGNVERFEDVKKTLYTGCVGSIINLDAPDIYKALKEASKRFGKDKIYGYTTNAHILNGKLAKINDHDIDDLVGCIIFEPVNTVVATDVILKDTLLKTIVLSDDATVKDSLLSIENVAGFAGKAVDDLGDKVYEYKLSLFEKKICDVDIFKSTIEWKDMKLDKDGLVPVVVQDHKTDEVLMVAYMNEESFNLSLKTRKMTYWSRSRQSLWLKGETSGHFQYIKSLSIDCDNDTILAKVIQIGAACHTGNKSCFYRDLVNDNEPSVNPYKVFEDVYAVIKDRKVNPKEGSYTNYLFDKGIDKILKKVGEEATEIVIAAKNPDKEEIKYEVADFLYHVMVLMVERGVTWEDITEELAHR